MYLLSILSRREIISLSLFSCALLFSVSLSLWNLMSSLSSSISFHSPLTRPRRLAPSPVPGHSLPHPSQDTHSLNRPRTLTPLTRPRTLTPSPVQGHSLPSPVPGHSFPHPSQDTHSPHPSRDTHSLTRPRTLTPLTCPGTLTPSPVPGQSLPSPVPGHLQS